jgi:anaerobic selenocysteine-containing dehydrogenase
LSRRSFLKAVGAAAAAVPAGRLLAAKDPVAAVPVQRLMPRPTRAQVTWQDCEVRTLWSFDLPIAARDFTDC